MIDEKDLEILKALRENSKISINALSKKTGIPPATVHHRIKRLEKAGTILRYTIEMDEEKAGYTLHAYVFLSIQPLAKGKLDQRKMSEKLSKHELVQDAAVLAGDVDMLLKVRARNMDELNHFILDYLRNIEGVDKTKTLMVMHSAKGA